MSSDVPDLMAGLKWSLGIGEPPETCGAQCPRNRYAHCEYPPGHSGQHTGRDSHGKWWIWRGTYDH